MARRIFGLAAALVLMGLVLILGIVARWATRQRYGRVR